MPPVEKITGSFLPHEWDYIAQGLEFWIDHLHRWAPDSQAAKITCIEQLARDIRRGLLKSEV